MHENGHYLLPAEFLLLLAVWLVPPLLVGFTIQFIVLRKRLRLSLAATAACFIATSLLSVVGLVGVLASGWQPLKVLSDLLALRAPFTLLFMPDALLVVGVVATVVAYVFAKTVREA